MTEGKGWGLRTCQPLPKGSFVCEFKGEILTNTELFERIKKSGNDKSHTYPLILDADWVTERYLKDDDALCLDATWYGNVARFINHRCNDANLINIPVEIETPDHHFYHVAFFTKREVDAYEELTWDYTLDFTDDEHPIEAFSCCCGSKDCRDPNAKHKEDMQAQRTSTKKRKSLISSDMPSGDNNLSSQMDRTLVGRELLEPVVLNRESSSKNKTKRKESLNSTQPSIENKEYPHVDITGRENLKSPVLNKDNPLEHAYAPGSFGRITDDHLVPYPESQQPNSSASRERFRMDSDQRKLFIGGISWDTDEDELKQYLSNYGHVSHTAVKREKNTGKSRGFGFVVFSDPLVVDRVLKDQHKINGRIVDAQRVLSREEQKTLSKPEFSSNTSNNGGGGNMRHKQIFVGGLPRDLTEDGFRQYFETYGRVTDRGYDV